MAQIGFEKKRIVITGGPCTGKTTTIQKLKEMGYPIVPEAAAILIDQQIKSKGNVLPWIDLYQFNVKVTELQKELESLNKNAALVFLDRSFIDNLAYCKIGNIEPPENLLESTNSAKYNKIFFLEKLDKWEDTEIRRDGKQSEKINQAIFEAYKEEGYKPTRVPPFSVEERVEFILKNI